MTRSVRIVLTVVFCTLLCCWPVASQTPRNPAEADAGSVTGEIVLLPPKSGTAFGYHGSIGPTFWGDLDPAWALCSDGRAQSPIDLVAGKVLAVNAPDLVFDYHAEPLVILNNGHTVEVERGPGSSLTVQGESYALLQFHFHGPSEHTFEQGAQFDLEMHLVHRNSRGELAVAGVLIREGAAAVALQGLPRLKQLLPAAGNQEYTFPSLTFNPAALLPAGRSFFHYMGSLTTPPCTEGVRWFVIRNPIEMSAEQIGDIRGAIGGANARPPQPLHGRTVLLDILPGVSLPWR